MKADPVRTIYDLMETEEGDYGQWCIYVPLDDTSWRLVYYDDDDYWCSHGRDENDLEHECSEKPAHKDDCFVDSGAIVYESENITLSYMIVPHMSLYPLPVQFEASRPPCERGTWIYVVALLPEDDIRRIKVGYTERPVAQRVAQYRTTNPQAVVIGLWEAPRDCEEIAHSACDGRIGNSEVFQVADILKTLRSIDAALSKARARLAQGGGA